MAGDKREDRLVMTVPEAGRLLGLSRCGAYEAAKRGDIPTIKIGRSLRVSRAALDRMLEGGDTVHRTTERDTQAA